MVVAVWYSRLRPIPNLYLLQLGAQLRETVKEKKVRQQAKASKEPDSNLTSKPKPTSPSPKPK